MKTSPYALPCGTVITALLMLGLGCSTTRFTSTWKAPDASLTHIEPGSKVGALIMSPDVSLRRAAEDALAAELTKRGVQGMPAYSILGEGDVQDEAEARADFERAGAVAVVVMRGLGEDIEVSYQPPTYYTAPYYGGFWGGYYGHSWNVVQDPGYLQTSRIVTVETLVYDLKSNKLAWGGRSRTTDPSRLGSFIKGIVDEAVKEMKKDGVL